MRDQMLVVTDVENTLYDWLGLWAGAFSAMLQPLADGTGRSRDHWIKAAQRVHLRRGGCECPSLLCDLAADPMWPAVDATKVMPAAATAYREYWDHHLTAYHGVREALAQLSGQGHAVVAYTEGDVSIAATRLARLGLAGIVRRAFGRTPLPGSREPSWSTVNVLRNGPIALDFIPREDLKPNPTGLRTIIALCDATPQNTIYLGDHLLRDVRMAQTLGAGAVWARYGTAHAPEHLALLECVGQGTPQALATGSTTTLNSITPEAVLDDPRELASVIARRSLDVACI